MASDVADISLSSNGATFFSHQVGAAAIATLVDRFLAGWSGALTFRNGDYLAWTVVSGPPPSSQLLATLQAKLNQAWQTRPRVPLANVVLDVATEHDDTMLVYATQESGPSTWQFLGEAIEAFEEGAFPGGSHAIVAAETHGVAQGLSLALARRAADILGCSINAVHPDCDVALLPAAAASVDPGTVLWINAFQKDVRAGTEAAEALVNLLIAGAQIVEQTS